MFNQLLDAYGNNQASASQSNQGGINPLLAAAATFLGSEWIDHHQHQQQDQQQQDQPADELGQSHFWRNALLSGALAYGLNRYQQHQQQPQQVYAYNNGNGYGYPSSYAYPSAYGYPGASYAYPMQQSYYPSMPSYYSSYSSYPPYAMPTSSYWPMMQMPQQYPNYGYAGMYNAQSYPYYSSRPMTPYQRFSYYPPYNRYMT